MPNAPKTPARNVRFDDDLWDALQEEADFEGTDRSAWLRELAWREIQLRRRRRAREAKVRAQLRAVTRA